MSNLVTLVATCTPCGPWVSRPTSSWETEPGCISDVFHPGRQPRTATRLLRLKLAERGCLPHSHCRGGWGLSSARRGKLPMRPAKSELRAPCGCSHRYTVL